MVGNNKRIILNSIILYIRLIITGVIGLVVTRVILKNLGIDDFGIYAIVGGLVAMMAFVNTVMLAATNRFIAFQIGTGSVSGVNRIFNASLAIHASIVLLVIFIAVSVGRWYIVHYVNVPAGKLDLVLSVFYWSIGGAAISFMSVPYNGLLLAKEKFVVFCLTDIMASFCKLGLAVGLAYITDDRLLVYAAIMAVITALPTLVYALYCRRVFSDLVRFQIPRSWQDYKPLLGFSVWSGYGALATVGKAQGAVLLINYFFNIALNAALGIASSVNGIILLFSSSVGRAIAPQITKSYAAENHIRMENLVIASSKYTFFLLLLPAVPLLLEVEFILALWLTEVPPLTAVFIRLMIIDALIGVLNAGVPEAIFASGKIKWYQITLNTIFLSSLVLAYVLLKQGFGAVYLFYSYIIISVVALVVRQAFLRYTIPFINIGRIIKESYLPALSVVVSLVPLLCLKAYISPVIGILVAITWTLISIIIIGLKHAEKDYLRVGLHAAWNKITKHEL